MTRRSRRAILLTAGAAATPLLGVAAARVFLQVKIPDMTRDVAAIGGVHPLSGILSSLGILLWWTSATIWLFVALVQRGDHEAAGTGFHVYSGFLSAFLGLDDLFQIHEYLAPTYLKVPERLVFGLLAIATALYLWRYRRFLQRPDGVLLVVALAFLSGSVAIDAALEPWLWRLKDWSFFVEDGLKWLGICFWTAFCVVRSTSDLRSTPPRGSSEPPP